MSITFLLAFVIEEDNYYVCRSAWKLASPLGSEGIPKKQRELWNFAAIVAVLAALAAAWDLCKLLSPPCG